MGIYVVGMHRSGTSVLSRFAGLLVNYHGHRGAAHDNVEGHWEIPRVNYLLEAALLKDGHDWASPPLTPITWTASNQDSQRGLAKQVASLGSATWILKDPRLCLALEAMLTLPQPPAFVVATFRDPIEVARSIARRDGYEFEYGLALWENYTRLLLLQVQHLGSRVVWVSYEHLLFDPRRTAEELRGRFERWGVDVTEESVANAVAAVRPTLRHEIPATAQYNLLSDSQRELYGMLKACLSGGEPPFEAIPDLTPWARALLETRRPYIRMELANRLLRKRVGPLRPAYRAIDHARRKLNLPVPPDPFVHE